MTVNPRRPFFRRIAPAASLHGYAPAGLSEAPSLEPTEGRRVPLFYVLGRIDDEGDTPGAEHPQDEKFSHGEAAGLLMEVE